MSRPFPVALPLERAFTRNVLFAVEILDAVTLEPVTQNIRASAIGMLNGPIVNASGMFVWLEEGNRQPQKVRIDASGSFYESPDDVTAPVLPQRFVRIELAPKCGYPFPPGTTALRGTLIESGVGNRVAVVGAEVWLQWLDQIGPTWTDAPTHSHTDANGDFAALLRFTPAQDPALLSSGALRARLRVNRGNTTKTSAEFPLSQGRVTEGQLPFAATDLA